MVKFRPIDEVIDFITSFPKPEDVLAYKAPATVQKRAEELLYKKRETSLTESEIDELEQFLFIEHLVRMAKKNAKQKILS